MRSPVTALMIAAVWFTFGPGVSGTAGQCTDNEDCSALQYCEKSAGDCDGEGTCTERPSMCPDVWAPVCGCDAVTYANACSAAFAGINVASEGECPPPPCRENSDCEQGEMCLNTVGNCLGEGLCTEKPLICPMVWDPVCGCDESTYPNECSALLVGVNVAYEGECLTRCSAHGDCLHDEYCDTAHNGCWGTGACRLRPAMCLAIYDPVCGCNELTYDNACFAAMDGITVTKTGVCGACPFDASSDCIFTDSLESGGASRWSQVVN